MSAGRHPYGFDDPTPEGHESLIFRLAGRHVPFYQMKGYDGTYDRRHGFLAHAWVEHLPEEQVKGPLRSTKTLQASR